MTTNENKRQRVIASGEANENSIVHIEEWMIAIFSVTTSRD